MIRAPKGDWKAGGRQNWFLPACLLNCFFQDGPGMGFHSRSSRVQFPASSSTPRHSLITSTRKCQNYPGSASPLLSEELHSAPPRCSSTGLLHGAPPQCSSTVLLPASLLNHLYYWVQPLGMWLLTAGLLFGLLSLPITLTNPLYYSLSVKITNVVLFFWLDPP